MPESSNIDEEVVPAKCSRLGDCEVCAKQPAKYTCPECEVKTCSLSCVKIHKTELDCDGIRSRVKFKRMSKFSNLDILSDYRLLEETTRAVEAAKKTNAIAFHERRKDRNRATLLCGARQKEIGLKLLPPSFKEHKLNSTFYSRKTNEFFWKIKWKFCAADDYEVIENRVSDKTILSELVSKYLNPNESTDGKIAERLVKYNRDILKVEILLPAEGVPGKKFFLLNPRETIGDNLKYKNIIEHPTFFVILEEQLPEYKIVHIAVKNQNLLECNDDDD